MNTDPLHPIPSTIDMARDSDARTACCQVNVAPGERLASTVLGGALVIAGARRGSLAGLGVAALGGGLLYRGISGQCSLFRFLGINQPRSGVRAQQGVKHTTSLFIQKPRHEVFRFWKNLENLPRYMTHLTAVSRTEEGRSHWLVEGPLGTELEWDAEIINEREDELIAWQSLPGSQTDTAGSVHFEDGKNGGTVIHVSLKYDPPAGKLGANLASVLGIGAEQRIAADLRDLKLSLDADESRLLVP